MGTVVVAALSGFDKRTMRHDRIGMAVDDRTSQIGKSIEVPSAEYRSNYQVLSIGIAEPAQLLEELAYPSDSSSLGELIGWNAAMNERNSRLLWRCLRSPAPILPRLRAPERRKNRVASLDHLVGANGQSDRFRKAKMRHDSSGRGGAAIGKLDFGSAEPVHNLNPSYARPLVLPMSAKQCFRRISLPFCSEATPQQAPIPHASPRARASRHHHQKNSAPRKNCSPARSAGSP
jgi:hypothetical protein